MTTVEPPEPRSPKPRKAKDGWKAPEAGRGRKGPPLVPQERARSLDTLTADFWPPEQGVLF